MMTSRVRLQCTGEDKPVFCIIFTGSGEGRPKSSSFWPTKNLGGGGDRPKSSIFWNTKYDLDRNRAIYVVHVWYQNLEDLTARGDPRDISYPRQNVTRRSHGARWHARYILPAPERDVPEICIYYTCQKSNASSRKFRVLPTRHILPAP